MSQKYKYSVCCVQTVHGTFIMATKRARGGDESELGKLNVLRSLLKKVEDAKRCLDRLHPALEGMIATLETKLAADFHVEVTIARQTARREQAPVLVRLNA